MNTELLSQLLEDRADQVSLRSGSLSAVRRRAARRTARTRAAIGAAGVAAVGGVVAAVSLPGDSPQRVASPDTSVGPTSTPTATTAPLETAPATTAAPLAAPLSKGVESSDVVELEQTLTDLGFDPGPVDGVFDDSTEQAVWAFEGLSLGRPYDQQTGVVDNPVWQALATPTVLPRRPESGTHVEIYLDLQVAVVFTNDEPTLITHISSGSGAIWCEEILIDTDIDGQPIEPPALEGICGEAKTPGGVFTVSRVLPGERHTSIGGMFNPVYFNYGIALHGASDVPVMPVSHGAIRIPMHIAEYIPSLVHAGDAVLVWDGIIEPEDQTPAGRLPTFNYPDPATATTTTG